jgi:YVTN family beta-propeller protein/autotransporter-associated beta strand protein
MNQKISARDPIHPDPIRQCASRQRATRRTPWWAGLATALALLASGRSVQAQVSSYAVVPNKTDSTVSIIDTATQLVVGSPFVVGGEPQCSAMTRDGRYAYVTTGSAGSVARIDLPIGTAIQWIPVSASPTCVVLTPDGLKAYVSDQTLNGVSVLDLSTATVIGSPIPVGATPAGLAVTPDGAHVYVVNTADNTVSVIDTGTDTVSATIPVGATPATLVIAPDGATGYVVNTGDDTVSVIDLTTATVTATIVVSDAPTGIDITPDGTRLVVTGTGSVDFIDAATQVVTTTLALSTTLTGVAITPDGHFAWVLDSIANTAIPIDLTTDTPLTPVTVGNLPFALVPFIGPNLIVPAPGPMSIASDSDLTSSGFGSTFVDFAGGTLQLTGAWSTSRTVSFLASGGTIDTNGQTATLTGATVGEGTLTKIGAGTLILSGAAGHAGTTVSDGTFQVDGTHSATITVAGGTLTGAGVVGDVTVTTGGLRPGSTAATGILSAAHVTFSTGTTFSVRLNGPDVGTDYDSLGASVSADLNDATLSVQLGYVPTIFTTFAILTNATGTFNGLPEGAIFTVGGKTFHITYQGGSGSDVRLDFDEAPTLSSFSDVTQPATSGPAAIPFVVIDDLTAPIVTATSSNTTLVPNANLTITGTSTNRTLTVTPAPHNAGTSTITVTASDGVQTTQRTFLFTVTDAPPVLAPIAPQTMVIGGILGPLTLTVSDDVTLTSALGITATSSNQALVSNSNIFIGSGAQRTLALTPATHGEGQSTITVTVTDGANQSVQQSFLLTVEDGPPTIGGLGAQTIPGGSVLGPIAFTVGDDLTAPSALVVTATSSNDALVPDGDLVLGGSGATRTLTATPLAGQTGSTVITVNVSDGTHTATQTFLLTVTNVPIYYLAEGATGAFFTTDISIANPNNVSVAATMTFYKADGSTIVRPITLAATSRTTVHVSDIAGLESASFATAVSSPGGQPLVVERTMTWDATGYGSHGEKASNGPATTWYFAEGSQGFFHTYFLLLNLHSVPNLAHVTYFLEDGSPLQRDYPLAATSRTTLDIGAEPALANRSFGAVITFDLPGMAERAMYFGDSPLFSGGHDSAGVTAPSTSWFLAEGATGAYFDTFVLIANPNDTAATVTTTYLPASGVPVPKTHIVAPHQRLTLNIAAEDPTLASAAVATSVSSSLPVVVERSQYWPHDNWAEAHNSAGETTAALKWGLAEGRVGGTNHAQTYVLLANAGDQTATVTATFLRTDGTTIVKTVTVAPTSRVNIAITGPGSDVPELADETFSTIIESTQPIIVERSMYTDANGVTWAAGTNATASRLP